MKLLGIIGAIGLLLGVTFGAFGAHALKGQLSEQMQNVFEIGVRYQLIHSLAIVLSALLAPRQPLFFRAGLFYTAGIVLFSFSLYLLALTGIPRFGAITPLGGISFLIGHGMLLIGFIRLDRS